MEFVPLTSSTVAAVGYDDAQATLGVRFNNGREYHYFGVPREVYDGILGASSVGRYFDQYVKKAGYPFQRVN